MITEVSGDILLTKAQALAHGVAPHDHFQNGLALALREQWPSLARDFRHYCHQDNPKPGTAWAWAGTDGRRIICLLTQSPAAGNNTPPGRATTEYVNGALRELRRMVEAEKFTSLALPRLATGVGGLDWANVKPLIEQHLGDLPIPVYVYTTYHKGQAADES